MLINGIELSTLGIELYDRILYSNDIDTSQDWLDGDIQPTFIRQQDRFKNIKLDFLVLCADEEEAFLVSFDLMKDVPVAHMERNCGFTDIYLEWDFDKHGWKIVRIC